LAKAPTSITRRTETTHFTMRIVVLIAFIASAEALRLAIPHSKTSKTMSLGELQQNGGKKDFAELKTALSQMEPYVFIRDYKYLQRNLDGGDFSEHVPTKVLLGVDSPPIRPYKSGDFYEGRAPKHPFNGKMLNTVRYKFSKGHTVDIGFSKVGDNYYDPKWAVDMLKRRQRNEDGLWVLSAEDHFYELLYHSIVQWPGNHQKAHQSELAHLAHKIGVKYSGSNDNNNKHDKKMLKEFMTEHNYTSTNPFHKRKKPETPTKYSSLKVFPRPGNVSKPECKKTHFIHIGKTGGSTVKDWLKRAYPGVRESVHNENGVNPSLWRFGKSQFMLHGHDFTLGQGGPFDCYAFFVRDPVERWVSGFLSRLRKDSHGAGKGFWNEQEQVAFTRFPRPEALARALGSHDPGERAEALKANDATVHTKRGIASYLPNIDKYMDRILFVGDVNTLGTDFKRMCELSGMPAGQPIKEEAQNLMPEKQAELKHLTPKAETSLKRFLKADYAVLDKLAKHGFLRTEDDEDAVTGDDDEHATVSQNWFSLLVDREDDEDVV